MKMNKSCYVNTISNKKIMSPWYDFKWIWNYKKSN